MLCNKIHFIISYFVALSVYNVNIEAYTGSYAHKICLRLRCDSEANASESQHNLRHISVTVIDLRVLESVLLRMDATVCICSQYESCHVSTRQMIAGFHLHVNVAIVVVVMFNYVDYETSVWHTAITRMAAERDSTSSSREGGSTCDKFNAVRLSTW